MAEPTPERAAGQVAPHLPRFARRIGSKDVTARRAIVLISGVTIVMAVAGGVLMRLIDKSEFSSLGQGLWWSLQTVTTVGYGDIVPHNVEGRIIAGIVMLTGIAFIAVITAAVTAALIEGARRDQRQSNVDAFRNELLEINARLIAIEERLTRE